MDGKTRLTSRGKYSIATRIPPGPCSIHHSTSFSALRLRKKHFLEFSNFSVFAYSIATRIPPGQKSSKTGLGLNSWSKMRFLTILKFLKIHQKINFCSARGVTGKSRGQPTHPTKSNSFFLNGRTFNF